jgi:hypothetical protein
MHPQGRRNIDGRENVKTLSSVILLAAKFFIRGTRGKINYTLAARRGGVVIFYMGKIICGCVPGERLRIIMSGAVLYWSALPHKLLHLGVSLTRVILQEK